jgi:hypothetical protein
MTEIELYDRAQKQIRKTEVLVELPPGIKRYKVSCRYRTKVIDRAFVVDAFSEEDAHVLAKYRILDAGGEFEFLKLERTWRGLHRWQSEHRQKQDINGA